MYIVKSRALISCTVMVQLMCAFVFAYAGFLMMGLINYDFYSFNNGNFQMKSYDVFRSANQ